MSSYFFSIKLHPISFYDFVIEAVYGIVILPGTYFILNHQ